MTDFSRFDAIIDEHLEDWIAELLDFCRIPSEGGDLANLRLAADWTAERLRRAGCAVEVLELGDGVPPLIVGELGEGPRTLTWEGRDVTGRIAARGLDFVRAGQDGRCATRKLVRA